jgi:hypothetical protein
MGNITKPKSVNVNDIDRLLTVVKSQQMEVSQKLRKAKAFFKNSEKRVIVNQEELNVIMKLPEYIRDLTEEKLELDQQYASLVFQRKMILLRI